MHIDVSPTVGLARVTARMADPTRASDADPALHDQLRTRFVPPTDAEGMRVVRVDGEGTTMCVAAEGMAGFITNRTRSVQLTQRIVSN
jgi:hypothetical protein